jgi:hypothetical protein
VAGLHGDSPLLVLFLKTLLSLCRLRFLIVFFVFPLLKFFVYSYSLGALLKCFVYVFINYSLGVLLKFSVYVSINYSPGT